MRIWERMEQNVHIKSPAHAGLGYSSKSSTGLDWESPLALRRWTCLGLLPVYSYAINRFGGRLCIKD
ncbi:hypothetical protein TWF751_007653 [Orbilia oligospora]|nr:hypothetical protein TWF751_007653 [Orbilia oligospora]